MVKVAIIEFEAYWVPRSDEYRKFKTRKEAENFCKEYNKDNNLSVVPDWYMKAEIISECDC